ncbi:putative cytochrome p450 protein [Botrytis fragariae]|uniref:Putative cytochrome p450 protein n=1 Tax=Botrytis fragariae TaxID=1964551 RepID=A0A8H6AZ96_9HELO|nr:putative cytochrome p450 protein [Botrytis fragariae]KAF5876518.1 putative cytochrome p450 protein [Botrytis fragariae]
MVLGYEPVQDFEEGLKEVVMWSLGYDGWRERLRGVKLSGTEKMATLEIYVLFAITGVSFTLLTRAFCSGSSHESREPPKIKPVIHTSVMPSVSSSAEAHTIPKFTKNGKHQSFRSLCLAGKRTSSVGSPELMNSLQRQGKTASFWYLEARLTAELGGLSSDGMKKLAANLEPAPEKPSLLIEGWKATQQALSPLGGVDDMIRVAAENIQTHLDNLASEIGDVNPNTDLWAWVQHEITVATTESVSGPENPYRDSQVEAGFWHVVLKQLISTTLSQFLPNFVASKAIRGRARVVEAMSHYLTPGVQENGSPLIKARYASLSTEMSHADLARSKDAPILFSAQQETLRFRATGTQPRMVMEDMIVGNNQYLLRKDSMVIIANRALHYSKEIWRETADLFRANRFRGKDPNSPPQYSVCEKGMEREQDERR